MGNKEVWVYTDQYYEDIIDVRVFDDKQKMLDYIYEKKKNEVLEKLKKPAFDRASYETDKELHSYLDYLEKQYKEGTIGEYDTHKCVMNDNKIN